MIEGKDIVAKVQAKTQPSTWMVVRASGWSFITSGALVLFAFYALINDFSGKASLAAQYVPLPTLTWTVPTGSGFLLSVVVLAVVLGALIWQYLRQRQQALVLTPEGFVQANLRTGSVKRTVDYSAYSALALREAPEGEFEIIPRIHLELTDRQQQESIWRVENFYAMPAAEIARTVFNDFMHFYTPVAPSAQAEAEAAPEQLVAMARSGQIPDYWRVYTPKLPWRAYLGPLVVFVIGVFFVAAGINSYFIAGPSLPARFNMGRPFGDVLASELVTLVFSPLLLAFFVALEYVFLRKARMAQKIFIITQTRWIVANRRTGKVAQVLRYGDVSHLKLTYWYKSFTLFYRTSDGKRHAIVMAADSLKSPALVCQVFLARYSRQRARLGQP